MGLSRVEVMQLLLLLLLLAVMELLLMMLRQLMLVLQPEARLRIFKINIRGFSWQNFLLEFYCRIKFFEKNTMQIYFHS